MASVRALGGAIKGTGFLVLGRYVITCAHVVDDALGRDGGSPPGRMPRCGSIPFLGNTDLRARVVAWYPMRPASELVHDPLADIAVLELTAGVQLSGGLRPQDVDRRPRGEGSGFKTFGFPKGYDNGAHASGETLDLDGGGWLHVRDTQDYGYFIAPGYSGAPAFSTDELRLIGMPPRRTATRRPGSPSCCRRSCSAGPGRRWLSPTGGCSPSQRRTRTCSTGSYCVSLGFGPAAGLFPKLQR